MAIPTFTLRCRKCKSQVSLSSDVIQSGTFVVDDSNEYYLTYFECPKCGTRHFVQADSKDTRQRLQRLTRLMGTAAMAKSINKLPSLKLQRQIETNRRYLRKDREALQEYLTGKSLTDVYGVAWEVRFADGKSATTPV